MTTDVATFLRQHHRHTRWRCAYVGGTFDCFHQGHLALLAGAKAIADRVVASVNTDEFAAAYKRQPLMPLSTRHAVLQACRLVDEAIVNSGDADSRPAILRSGADVIVHGSDWVGEGLLQQMGLTATWLSDRRIDLVTLPYTPWTSTTMLLEAHARRSEVSR